MCKITNLCITSQYFQGYSWNALMQMMCWIILELKAGMEVHVSQTSKDRPWT